jgi:hypothetical protein
MYLGQFIVEIDFYGFRRAFQGASFKNRFKIFIINIPLQVQYYINRFAASIDVK